MSSVLAIDIGGTKMAAAIVDEHGGVHAEHETPTRASSGEELFNALVTMCDDVLTESGVQTSELVGVGVGWGGPMRYPKGKVSPLNIHVWRGFPLRERLHLRYGRPTIVDNDAKAYALGEYWIGAAPVHADSWVSSSRLGSGVGSCSTDD